MMYIFTFSLDYPIRFGVHSYFFHSGIVCTYISWIIQWNKNISLNLFNWSVFFILNILIWPNAESALRQTRKYFDKSNLAGMWYRIKKTTVFLSLSSTTNRPHNQTVHCYRKKRSKRQHTGAEQLEMSVGQEKKKKKSCYRFGSILDQKVAEEVTLWTAVSFQKRRTILSTEVNISKQAKERQQRPFHPRCSTNTLKTGACQGKSGHFTETRDRCDNLWLQQVGIHENPHAFHINARQKIVLRGTEIQK